jgi:phage shock protein A
MSWLERIGRVIRANINSLIEETQEPEKILEQAVLALEQELIEMRRALAEAIASHKSMERQILNHQAMADRLYKRAQLALDEDNEAKARESLSQRQLYQHHAQSLQEHLDSQKNLIGKFKQDLHNLERKYAQVKSQKNFYIARLRSAAASHKMQELFANFDSSGSLNLFEQLEAKILEIEAESELLKGTINPDPLEQQFMALEGGNQVEAELNNLKAKKQNNPHSKNLPPSSQQSNINSEIAKLYSDLDRL